MQIITQTALCVLSEGKSVCINRAGSKLPAITCWTHPGRLRPKGVGAKPERARSYQNALPSLQSRVPRADCPKSDAAFHRKSRKAAPENFRERTSLRKSLREVFVTMGRSWRSTGNVEVLVKSCTVLVGDGSQSGKVVRARPHLLQIFTRQVVQLLNKNACDMYLPSVAKHSPNKFFRKKIWKCNGNKVFRIKRQVPYTSRWVQELFPFIKFDIFWKPCFVIFVIF